MAKKKENGAGCLTTDRQRSCCRIESVITVDERGQMVLPKEIRDKTRIHAGDKLAVVIWEKDGNVSCISLIKTEDFSKVVKGLLGPMVEEVTEKL